MPPADGNGLPRVWELPYTEETRSGLFYALVQARAVLAWLRYLEAAGVSLKDVTVRPRGDAVAGLNAIGGEDVLAIREKASGWKPRCRGRRCHHRAAA